MTRIAPDARQLSALHAQLGLLEQMLKPVVSAPNNVVPMPQPQRAPPAMQNQLMEQMLIGMDPQRGAQVRALMAVANKPNVSHPEMEAAVAPLLSQLSAQDQSTVRMMLTMMQRGGGQPPSTQQQPAAPPAPPVMTQEMQNAFETISARAATALEEVRRVAAELVTLKDTQNQTAAAMFQQTQVMREMLNMMRGQPSSAPDEPADEPVSPHQDAAV